MAAYTPSARLGSASRARARSRAEYRSVRSVNRDGYPSGGAPGPASGDRPVRLRWSRTRTGWPTLKPAAMPPAALVSATTRQPAATAVRTPCTTTLG